ncbi:Lipoprotein [Pararobbsia alpina]
MKLRPLLTLMLCATLAACATDRTTSIKQSLAPVHTLIPTIDCGEDKPDVQLTDYPVGPFIRRADIASESLEQLRTSAYQLYDYSQSQQLWGVHAVGVVEDEYTLRHNTRDCLGGLRTRGLIN